MRFYRSASRLRIPKSPLQSTGKLVELVLVPIGHQLLSAALGKRYKPLLALRLTSFRSLCHCHYHSQILPVGRDRASARLKVLGRCGRVLVIEAVVPRLADNMTTIRAGRLVKSGLPATKNTSARPQIIKIAAKVFAIISPSCIAPLSQMTPVVPVNAGFL